MEIREIKTFEIFISNALFVSNTTIVFNFFFFSLNDYQSSYSLRGLYLLLLPSSEQVAILVKLELISSWSELRPIHSDHLLIVAHLPTHGSRSSSIYVANIVKYFELRANHPIFFACFLTFMAKCTFAMSKYAIAMDKYHPYAVLLLLFRLRFLSAYLLPFCYL